MIILLIVIGMIFLMAMFSYLYLYGVHPSFWTSPPSLFWLLLILAAHGCDILLALLACWLLTREGTTLWTSAMLILLASISLLVSLGGMGQEWCRAGVGE